MAQSVFPVVASQPALHPTSIPANVTLRNTYTTSQSGLTYPAGITQVFAVLVGGGGEGGQAGGYSGTHGGGGGGGGGAVNMGWIPAPATITIGSSAGYSKVGNLNASPGGIGVRQDYYGQEFVAGAGTNGSGAGGGNNLSPVFIGTNPFIGGGKLHSNQGSGNNIRSSSFDTPGVHSGMGGNYNSVGQTGFIIGGGGGGNDYSANGGNGGAGNFSAGLGATSGSARGGGGGSGYLAAGGNATTAGPGTGGTGGSGGGGGGGGGSNGSSINGNGGAGGTGCCLIYY